MKLLLNLVIFILIKSQCCNFLRFHLACLWNFSNLRNYTCRHEVKNSPKTYTVRSFYELFCNFIFFHFMYIEHIIIINKLDVLKIVLKLLVVMCCGMQCYIQQQTRKKSQTSWCEWDLIKCISGSISFDPWGSFVDYNLAVDYLHTILSM